jgi:hypothetical protein
VANFAIQWLFLTTERLALDKIAIFDRSAIADRLVVLLCGFPLRSLLFIAVLIVAAASTAIIPSLSPDGRGRLLSRLGAGEKHVRLAQTRRIDREVQSKPRLILQQSASGAVDDVIPLGVQVVNGRTIAGTLEIQPLPAGMAISSGRPIGTVWRIRAADAVNATIHPPAGFSGAVDLTVDLRLSDDSLVDTGSVHREWLQRPSASEPVRGVTDSDITAKNVVATLTPADETARLETNLRASHRVHNGTSVETGSTKDVWNVRPRADARHTATASPSAKRKRGAVRSRIRAQAAPDDHYQVYYAGRPVGADPDLNIRMTLARGLLN